VENTLPRKLEYTWNYPLKSFENVLKEKHLKYISEKVGLE